GFAAVTRGDENIVADGGQTREALGHQGEERHVRIATENLEHGDSRVEHALRFRETCQIRKRHQRQAPTAPADAAEKPIGCAVDRLRGGQRDDFGHRGVGQQQARAADGNHDAADLLWQVRVFVHALSSTRRRARSDGDPWKVASPSAWMDAAKVASLSLLAASSTHTWPPCCAILRVPAKPSEPSPDRMMTVMFLPKSPISPSRHSSIDGSPCRLA